MPIPDYQALLLPALQSCDDGQEHRPREVVRQFAKSLNLTTEEEAKLLPSGTQTVLANRTNWALYYLFRAGLLRRPSRGRYLISEEGRRLLARQPGALSANDLKQYPSFQEFCTSNATGNKSPASTEDTESVDDSTPLERIESASLELNSALADELLQLMGEMDPFRFEQLVIDLLFSMGYGGSREEAATVTQRTNDGGIDGVINEDRLGLNVIYVQAKRWKDNVGRTEIQNFIGALAGKKAGKGIFITTSDFRRNAYEFAESISQKVILINGKRLATLMIEHNVGVSAKQVYRIKDVDRDYFED